MKIICAWCEKEIEDPEEQAGTSKYEVSHGICLSCKERFLSNEEYTLERFLNRLDAPVLVVNREGVVVLANQSALDHLGKGMDEVKGYRGGEVMECAYAALPGGCGHTVHCVACTIRNNVMETFETAECKRRVPAYLNQVGEKGREIVDYLISTERLDEFVLLRIDGMVIRGMER